MNISTPNRTLRHRLAKTLTSVFIVVGSIAAVAGPASAETDTLDTQCISVYGMARGCATNINVVWGSGWSWSAGASTKDTMIDNGNVVVEIKLNRKHMSNTSWIQVSRATDHMQYYGYSSTRGYDPTYGAWVRVCTNLNTGKYCLAERYVTDHS